MAPLTAPSLFFAGATRFAVVGASKDRTKFGNKVLRWYIARGLPVTPVNPRESEIEGLAAVRALSDLPGPRGSLAVSIIAPPAASEGIVDEAIRLGVLRLWFQPGSWTPAAVDKGQQAGLHVVNDCVLVNGDAARAAAASAAPAAKL